MVIVASATLDLAHGAGIERIGCAAFILNGTTQGRGRQVITRQQWRCRSGETWRALRVAERKGIGAAADAAACRALAGIGLTVGRHPYVVRTEGIGGVSGKARSDRQRHPLDGTRATARRHIDATDATLLD
jgi:hypothetical protein